MNERLVSDCALGRAGFRDYLHFDRLEDHDAAWLKANHPNDVRQVEDYSRITRDVTPALWATLRQTIADLNRSPDHACGVCAPGRRARGRIVRHRSTRPPKDVLSGAAHYTPDQVKIEPNFSPETEPQRRAIYTGEAPHVKYFEYANLPGYVVFTVNGPSIVTNKLRDMVGRVCSGTIRTTWKTLPCSNLLRV